MKIKWKVDGLHLKNYGVTRKGVVADLPFDMANNMIRTGVAEEEKEGTIIKKKGGSKI